jgi:hypothetical protein
VNGRGTGRVPSASVGYVAPMSDPQRHDDGEVSEVGQLDPEQAETPISDGDAVGGYPTSESGEPDEGEELGPDADQFRDREVR